MEVGTATVHASATLTDSGRDGDRMVGHDLYDDPNAHRVDDIHDFCSAIFKNVPEPLLPRPTSPLQQTHGKEAEEHGRYPLEYVPRGASINSVGG